jgi:hypothetical protein
LLVSLPQQRWLRVAACEPHIVLNIYQVFLPGYLSCKNCWLPALSCVMLKQSAVLLLYLVTATRRTQGLSLHTLCSQVATLTNRKQQHLFGYSM